MSNKKGGAMRAATLADACRAMALISDQLVRAVRSGDLDRIEAVLDQAGRQLPPHPFTPSTVLAVVLAAQIDTAVPLEQRLAWVAPEPTLEVVA